MFAIFQILTVFGQLVQQTMPHFVIQRSLYEVRERPSKVYGWKVFMLSQIIVELPWNTLMGALMFFCWYYPVGLYANAADAGQTAERGALMFLLLVAFLLFTSTFTDFIIAGFETAEAGGNIANLLFMLCLIFCGVLANPDTMPRFWIFMYRLSPFTYLVSAMLSTAVANTEIYCAANEFIKFEPISGSNCGEYMRQWMVDRGGYLLDPSNETMCSYCPIRNTNDYLASVKSDYADRWRNFGYVSHQASLLCSLDANGILAFSGCTSSSTSLLLWLFTGSSECRRRSWAARKRRNKRLLYRDGKPAAGV
jgi:ABC-type multidrug transport system permease subunit